MSILNTGAKLVNLADGTLVDAIDVAGSYFVTQSIDITSTGEAGKIPDYACIEGAICYCKNDNRFYQYNGEKWVFADTVETIKLSEDLWTDKTIGYIQGTASAPVKIARAGESLKTVFTNIFGTVTDDTSNLVTNPYISSVSIGNSSYEYGTKLTSVSVTVTPVAGSYKYGPAVEGADWSGHYLFKGDGFVTKSDSGSNSQTITLAEEFTVGVSSALTLNVGRAYVDATNTAKSKMGVATDQKITGKNAKGSGTFNPHAQKSVYYTTTTTLKGAELRAATWNLYNPNKNGMGQTSVTDITIHVDAGNYLWIASTGKYQYLRLFNEVSNKYNTEDAAVEKVGTAYAITNSQGVSADGYYLIATGPRTASGDVKLKLSNSLTD